MTISTNGVQTQHLASLAVNAYLGSFSAARERDFGRSASTIYAGARDVYSAIGYPTDLRFVDYLGRYQRQDVATRIVEAAAEDTWRLRPAILDGVDRETGRNDTDFVEAWLRLAQPFNLDSDQPDEEERSVWHYFNEADQQCGIGQYAILLLGFTTGQLNEPLNRNGGGALAYITVLHEGDAEIRPGDLDTNPASPRFGKPVRYWVDLHDNTGRREVHFSRVLHVADGGVLYGQPRLKNVYNRLIDVEKLLSSSAESGWRGILRRVIFTTKDGYKLAETTITQDLVDELLHGFRSAIEVEGVDVTVIGGELIDPSRAIDAQMTFIAAGTGIPKRKLAGSERGELASSQDDDNWNDLVAARRTSFAEPVIIRPFIKRMIWAGVLPRPTSGSVFVDWPSLYDLDDKEQAEMTDIYAQAMQRMATPGMERVVNPGVFVRHFVRGLPPDAVPDEAELLADENEDMGDEEPVPGNGGDMGDGGEPTDDSPAE